MDTAVAGPPPGADDDVEPTPPAMRKILAQKFLDWAKLAGVPAEDTNAAVLRALELSGRKDETALSVDAWLEDFRGALRDGALAELGARSDASGLLVRAMLHALAARHPDSEKLASLVGDVAAEDYLPGQQPAVGEHLAAALDELPPELALSLRAVQSRPQQGDVQRLWDYFASGSALAKGKERILRRRAVVENLLRVTPSAPPQLHKQLFHIIAVAVGRPGDTELLESLSALVVAVQDLRTHLNLGPLLQAVKDPVPAAVVVKEVRKFLSDPEQAESMLRMGKWGALGVLLEIALRHRHLRQLVVDAYILLLGLGYDSQFKPLDLIKIRQRFLAELVGIMSLDADTARSVMSWTMSPDSEDVLDGELRSHLLRVFLSSTQPSPLPEPCLRFLLSNLSRIRAQEPSLQAFSHRLGRTGLSGMLRPVVLENDGWDGLASDMEASGEIAPGTGAAVGDVVLI